MCERKTFDCGIPKRVYTSIYIHWGACCLGWCERSRIAIMLRPPRFHLLKSLLSFILQVKCTRVHFQVTTTYRKSRVPLQLLESCVV